MLWICANHFGAVVGLALLPPVIASIIPGLPTASVPVVLLLVLPSVALLALEASAPLALLFWKRWALYYMCASMTIGLLSTGLSMLLSRPSLNNVEGVVRVIGGALVVLFVALRSVELRRNWRYFE